MTPQEKIAYLEDYAARLGQYLFYLTYKYDVYKRRKHTLSIHRSKLISLRIELFKVNRYINMLKNNIGDSKKCNPCLECYQFSPMTIKNYV